VSDKPTPRLWEIDHPYYCSRSNFYAKGNDQPFVRYRSWSEFLREEGDFVDYDYNLLFRWDWLEGEGWELPEFNGDENYRNGLLMLFWMGQRKGLYRWSEVEICRADEPEVRRFLEPRLAHLLALWSPLIQTQPPPIRDALTA
jgi:hypothetical protein